MTGRALGVEYQSNTSTESNSNKYNSNSSQSQSHRTEIDSLAGSSCDTVTLPSDAHPSVDIALSAKLVFACARY